MATRSPDGYPKVELFFPMNPFRRKPIPILFIRGRVAEVAAQLFGAQLGGVHRILGHAALALGEHQFRVVDGEDGLFDVGESGDHGARGEAGHFRSRLCSNQRLADKNTITTTI
jgi:hypothetical protein